MWLQPSRGRRRGVGAPSARAPTPAVRGSDRGAWSGPSGCCGRRHQIPAALQALQLRAAAAAKSPRTVCTIRAPGRPRRSRSSAALRGASALEELWGVVGTEDRLTGVDSATPPLKRSVWEPPGSGLSWGTLHRTGGPRRHNSEPPPATCVFWQRARPPRVPASSPKTSRRLACASSWGGGGGTGLRIPRAPQGVLPISPRSRPSCRPRAERVRLWRSI